LPGTAFEIDDRINECDYGSWNGKELKELATDPLWESVMKAPTQVRFPSGESFVEIQNRMVEVVEQLRMREIQSAALVSHGDPIRLLLAHYLKTPLDDFQRISIAPASISLLDFSHNQVSISALNVTMPSQRSESSIGGGDSA
jgi:probable phosphoglycerate mutase